MVCLRYKIETLNLKIRLAQIIELKQIQPYFVTKSSVTSDLIIVVYSTEKLIKLHRKLSIN